VGRRARRLPHWIDGRPAVRCKLQAMAVRLTSLERRTGFSRIPSFSISTSQTSPSLMYSGGFRAAPDASGVVPVTIHVSGLERHCFTQNANQIGNAEIISSVEARWTTLPLRRVCNINPFAPGGNSSAVTNSGPNAPVPSKFLPTVHCGVLC